jgi:hypothetical protein
MSESKNFPYATFLDVKFPALSVVDAPALIKAATHPWYNQTLCKVNDSVILMVETAAIIPTGDAQQ